MSGLAALSLLVPLLILGAIVGAIVFAATGRDKSPGAAPLDFSEAVKSFFLHVVAFVALIVSVIGLIDLLQSFVAEDSFAGSSNDDLARGLASLIVGVPAYALLLRVILGRRTSWDRHNTGVSLGWSVYLNVSLVVLLSGAMWSLFQNGEGLLVSTEEANAEEFVQLVVWLGAWAAHWFVLRPRLGVRGDVHLAFGSVAGYCWMMIGGGGLIFRLLDRGYDSVTDVAVIGRSEEDFERFFVVFAIGAAVWAWHWLVHYVNSPRTALWHVVVVIVGSLIGLLSALGAGTTLVSGTLIYLLGERSGEDAAEFFDFIPATLVVLLLGLASWQYFRWILHRQGTPVRNEALRVYDYLVAGVGLVAVVGGVVSAISVLIEALAEQDAFAGSSNLINGVIVTVTVLIIGALMWFRYWSRIEAHRQANPAEELDSPTRKIYLVAAFGVGGLIVLISLIVIIFTLLRDVLDGEFGRSTALDVRGGVALVVAITGGAWYHLGVWRRDRAALAALTPVASPGPGPTAAPVMYQPPAPAAVAEAPAAAATAGIAIRDAVPGDYGELFTLQRAAFVDEAIVYSTPDVPALQETFAEFTERLGVSSTLVVVDGHRIVGAASLRTWRNGVPDIERLMVVPDRRQQNIATELMAEVERRLAAKGFNSVQLIVGEAAVDNRRLYERLGYAYRSQEPVADYPDVVLMTMDKNLAVPPPPL